MFSILERERAEMKIEEWLKKYKAFGVNIVITARGDEFDFDVEDSGGGIDGIRVESLEEGIQGVAKIIDGL